MKNCDAHNVCDHLSKRLVDGGKGFKALHTMKRDSNETRFLGVAYKMSANDKGLLLNYCPFCGGQPGYFERDADMPANAGGQATGAALCDRSPAPQGCASNGTNDERTEK